MTIDQIMALLRQVMPIVGTMLTVFGLSSATANSIVNLVMTGAGPTITLAGIIWSFIANTRASIMAAAAKPVALGVPAPQIVLPPEEAALAQALPDNVNTTQTVQVIAK